MTPRLALVLHLLAVSAALAEQPAVLPGTKPLRLEGDLSARMRAGIDRFVTRETERTVPGRARFWQRDCSSPQAYEKSIAANRERFRHMIGAIDERLPVTALELVGDTTTPALIVETEKYRIFAVRWPVFEGVWGEGLLLQPRAKPLARVVAVPDADQLPEALAGLIPGLPAEQQVARRLAESGCQVIVPVLIDRRDEHSGNPDIVMTNQSHREWIYRPAFELGRHIIGYEVQKVQAAIDWFVHDAGKDPARIGVAGYGEGGLIAFYTAALDRRIDAALVSGYFGSRQRLWEEPIDRNVWGLLRELGDAEIASLIVPRKLVIEHSEPPVVSGPPAVRPGRRPCAAPGIIQPPAWKAVAEELTRCQALFPADAKVKPRGDLLSAAGMPLGPFSSTALAVFLQPLDLTPAPSGPAIAWPKDRPPVPATQRQRRQIKQLVDHTQGLLQRSEQERARFLNKLKPTSVEAWQASCKEYRDYFWDDIIGRFPPADQPLEPQTRKILEREKWTGWEVVLPVWPDVFCWGVLLVPKDIRPGEKRPVVVCQHGLEGVPLDVIVDDPKSPHFAVYHAYAARLAERGFVTFAPHNFYRGDNEFRQLQRKLYPLKKTMFSIILAQHERHLDWLASLPFVDGQRIGFYGLSYGGFSAVRLPPLLDRYALSIDSAEFNDMVRKKASIYAPYSYPFYNTYEVFEFNLANSFGYGDLAGLMAPRPFMVERGHKDTVAPDEWVAAEYAKVRRTYAFLGIPDRTAIEFFNGGHEIHSQGTFDFLHRHLRWPKR